MIEFVIYVVCYYWGVLDLKGRNFCYWMFKFRVLVVLELMIIDCVINVMVY